MMTEYLEIINAIKTKTMRLHSVCQEQKETNNKLTEEIYILKKENNELKNEKDRILFKMETLKLSSTLNNAEGMKLDAKVQIDSLIREIDNCISLINKM